MRKLLFFSLIIIYSTIFSFSQDTVSFVFSKPKIQIDTSLVTEDVVEEHYLGENVASRWYHVKKLYSYIEKGTPTSPGDKTVIKRPNIYYSLKKIDKNFKKKIKKSLMTNDEAKDLLLNYLNIASYLYYCDTKDIENALKKADEPEDMEKIFQRVKFK